MSPALNESYTLQRFECGNAMETRNTVQFLPNILIAYFGHPLYRTDTLLPEALQLFLSIHSMV